MSLKDLRNTDVRELLAARGAVISEAWWRKLGLLAAVALFTTLLFFPSLTFFGFSYVSGDVAVSDVKSPVDIAAGGIAIKKGEIVVRDGQIVSDMDLRKFNLIEAAVNEKRAMLPVVGFFVFTVVLISVSYYFASRNIRKFKTDPKDLLLMSLLFLGVMALVRFSDSAAIVMKGIMPGVPAAVYRYMIPVAVGSMLIRLLLNSETALVFVGITSVMTGFFLGGSLDMAAYTLIGGITAAMGVRHCTHRSIVIRAGLFLGAVNVFTLMGILAIKGGVFISSPVTIMFAGLLNGVITAVLAIGIAPVFETVFQYTTDIKLLELSRMDHPILKELAMRAPGTYHHSIVIGTLVEAAAESISANPLLARVSAYYHDIGKINAPLHFIENISEENRHDALAPAASVQILRRHVTDGAALAEKSRLGREITDIIRQHHGTSLITFFYQKARAGEGASANPVDERDYRYEGPKPQTREAGIVMLADAIEAASKTLEDPTPEKLDWLMQKIVNRIFSDGQLDECELTLKDLHAITNSFNRVFAGVYHHRIDYPGTLDASKEALIEGVYKGGQLADKRALVDKKDGKERSKRFGL